MDAAKWAKSVVKVIADLEGAHQTAINASYASFADSTFKSLRRALPITRNKIDWNKIQTYRLGTELGNAASVGKSSA